MKVAVIGCGNISRLHFITLSENPDTEIVAVADIKQERADASASKYGAKAYYGIDELLENEAPDAIHICTPHYLHTAMAAKALAKGIHVLTEKPCSATLEEVDALRKAQSLSGKQLGICFQNRYNGCVQKAKNILDSGEMGNVKAIRAFVTWSRDADYYADDWHGTLEKECGGVLINQAIHTVDLVQYFGGKCKALTAHVANDHLKGVIEVEDNASIRMELENGVTAMLYATTAYAENSDVIVEILTEKGKLRVEGEKLYSFNEKGSIVEIECGSNVVYHGESYWGNGHSALINDFYDCLKNGRKFEIDAFEGGHAAKIVAASYKSAASGKSINVDL
ncbi:MAG: Gfo/Idh/MocA family oxidoreductase [Clostridia bacterium]|nr:Gfo/Idh/MocA family oxidoreductase [Clostridia bacterium]